MIFTRVDALMSLKPGCEFTWAGSEIYSELNYISTDTPPTEAELDAEVIRLQTAYDALDYQRKREAEYPDWQTQLDYIYHNGINKWKTDIVNPVKSKYPKPS
tara:strand:- start:25 stop:330 length:306 start_codon:yes stop_codon:yes gene_type:complete